MQDSTLNSHTAVLQAARALGIFHLLQKGLLFTPKVSSEIRLYLSENSSHTVCPGSQSETRVCPHWPPSSSCSTCCIYSAFREEVSSAQMGVAIGCRKVSPSLRGSLLEPPRPSVRLSLHHLCLESTRTREVALYCVYRRLPVECQAVDLVLRWHY